MNAHTWREGEKIYDGTYVWHCDGCGADIVSMEVDGPTPEECNNQHLPVDCNEAIPAVINEEYMAWGDDE